MTEKDILDKVETRFKKVARHVLDEAKNKAELAKAMADHDTANKEQIKIDTVNDITKMLKKAVAKGKLDTIQEDFDVLLADYIKPIKEQLEQARTSGNKADIINNQIRLSLIGKKGTMTFARGTFVRFIKQESGQTRNLGTA